MCPSAPSPPPAPADRPPPRLSPFPRALSPESSLELLPPPREKARAETGLDAAADDLHNSFHGRTFGAVSVTSTEKYRLPFAPLVPGVEFVRFNDLADLESNFDSTVCAVIVQNIQGECGIHPVTEAFWHSTRDLAPQHGDLLIPTEIHLS